MLGSMPAVNPCGHTDHFRSATRQSISDQVLDQLVRVVNGTAESARIRVVGAVQPTTESRALDLAYAVAWHHDGDGRWLAGTHTDPARLVHRLRLSVEGVTADGFELVARARDA